jgi:hypothetical protein
MKASQILKLVRDRLANNNSEYICPLLTNVSCEHPECDDVVRNLKAWVYSMLEPYATIEGWLQEITEGKSLDIYAGSRLRDVRLRWLDWMIQYCELEEAGWIPWLGGVSPPETSSKAIMRSGRVLEKGGRKCCWQHSGDLSLGDIIGYKP